GEICYAMMGENRFHSIFGSAEVNTSACTNACPAHTKISAYLAELREGKIEEAARIILDVNPMPFITSPVCAHFCQESCGRGTFDEGVNIGAIERYMGDYILENREKFYAPPEKENGKKIAIVGSGPAGLTAAYFLRKEGYAVTLFERMEEAGGCLAYAIPAYRLPKEVVKDFIGILKNMGIDFRLNELVGEDGISLESLYEGYDSVMLDTGTWKRPLIGISGEEMTKFGLDFLVDVNNYIHDKPGANVVVVGGGNVAADVAITAKRLGAPKVSMVCLESREEMPANNEEVERVLEEGVELHNGWGPKDVIKGDEGVSGIEFKHCKQVFDQGGKFAPQYEEDNLMNIEADVILMAIGQIAELDFLKGSFPVETERGRIKAIDGNKTNIPGLFAAGDVTTGPSTVIAAIAAGKNTVAAMKDYLGGEDLQPEIEAACEQLKSFSGACRSCNKATQIPEIEKEERSLDKEDFIGISKAAAAKEAERCMNCGCLAVNPSDMGNVLIALGAEVNTNMRKISVERLLTAKTRVKEALKPGEIVLEIVVPKPGNNVVASYDKFRYRKAIDFAILGIATTYTLVEGKIEDAKIVLGACAPIPIRASQAEAFLKGKAPSAEVALQAGELALAGALPLENNGYKIDIAKTLVKKSIENLY
ncbi:MAG: FAD-dependent oxidoreductase, partial [Anaerovoracaceae bacterium]